MNEVTTKNAFEAQIAACRHDAAALSEIEIQLRTLNAPWVGPMRLRVINMRRQLAEAKPSYFSPALAKMAAEAKMRVPSWGTPFGLPLPDGRPLYAYRLTSDAFAALEKHLKLHGRREGFAQQHNEALFVLWAAEWFRRSFKGGLRRWSDIGDHFGMNVSQASWRALADRGLAHWRLRPLRLNGLTHRLLALARQGGFPVAAIEEGASGWAAMYLARLVGVLLAEPNPAADIAFAHAQAMGAMLPGGWHHDDFFAVSADLALAIIALRREAENGGLLAGLPPSTWLDAHCPAWRDRLPLIIDSEAGRRLIDGLMKATVVKGGTGAVRVARILSYTDGAWQAQLQFELHGRLRGSTLNLLDTTWSRLRMFATAKLARYVPGELAVLEPAEGNEWVASASRRLDPVPVPLDVAAEVELRGGGERVSPTILLGQGAAVRALMLVCRAGDDADEELPKRLEVIGTVSGKYRPDPLYVIVPTDWGVEKGDTNDGDAEPLGNADEGRRLWRVHGGAIVLDADGDRYRLLAGQDHDERDALVLSGPPPATVTNIAGVPVYLGIPTPLVREHGRERAPRGDEVWWRASGTRDWRAFSRREARGACDLAWRDPTGLLRDRQSAIILPREFEATVYSVGDQAEVSIAGWPGSAEVSPGSRIGESLWRVRTRGVYAAGVTIRLETSGLSPVVLTARLPHEAWICDWEDAAVAARGRIALADLHRFVARADGRCELMAQLLDRDNHRIPQAEIRWTFEKEMPLTTIRDDLAALLRPLGALDASVELSFNDGYEVYWYVCEFDTGFVVEPLGLVPTRAIVDGEAQIVGRALDQPSHEHQLGNYGLAEQSNHRPIALPPLEGCWLIYLKSGERVLSRPYWHFGRPLESMPPDLLGRAMAIPERSQRVAELEALCDQAEAGDDRNGVIINAMIELANGLRGMPPSTFDIFHLVAKRPLLAARLLFEAGEQELPPLVALEAGLPFAWPLIAERHWERAAELRFEALLAALPETLSDRLALAAGAIATTRTLIAALEPAMAPLLNQPSPEVPIAQAAQTFMQRAHDRAEGFALSPFRPQLGDLLPNWAFSEGYWRALDAPCAAARAAREEIVLDASQLRCVKDIARRHPRYFLEAFTAILKEHSLG